MKDNFGSLYSTIGISINQSLIEEQIDEIEQTQKQK